MNNAGENKHLFPFEKLEVWHLAKEFTKRIYSVTSRFPVEEKYGLASQLNRAAISVASNLAEGSARMSFKDQAHFSQLAYGSLMEVACQLVIGLELGFLDQTKYDELRQDVTLLSSKINALRRSQKDRMS